jgi:hypothetical protein
MRQKTCSNTGCKLLNSKKTLGTNMRTKSALCVQYTWTHAIQCVKIKEKISVEGNYSDIFKEVISTNISKSLYKISKMREGLI